MILQRKEEDGDTRKIKAHSLPIEPSVRRSDLKKKELAVYVTASLKVTLEMLVNGGRRPYLLSLSLKCSIICTTRELHPCSCLLLNNFQIPAVAFSPN